MADWRDIVAEKFKTIAQRGSKKDFFDIFAAIKPNRLTIEEAVSIFKKRFGHTDLNIYHVLRSLVYFEDADDEPNQSIVKDHAFSWEEVKSLFVGNIKEFEKYFTN